MVDVYDCALGLLRIGPFNYEPHAGVELLLQQTDDVILQCLSTTPEVEGPSWVKMVSGNTVVAYNGNQAMEALRSYFNFFVSNCIFR